MADILVAGAGGFIGGHLSKVLALQGHSVRCVDIKPISDWYQVHDNCQNLVLDLSNFESCLRAVQGIGLVYNLAADMGGMGFIESHKAECMLSVLINTHLLKAAHASNVTKFFFSSSACVYAQDKQSTTVVRALRESDAYPAMPEDGYGWEKLFSERMCRHFREDFGLEIRIARFHNVYGPFGTFDGGREKAPAALCRKVANAIILNEETIEIWGDGEQTRSFMFIDDCIKGSIMLMESNYTEPINIGSAESVSINELLTKLETISGREFKRKYNLHAPQGVRGRNSDNTVIKSVFNWEPDTSLDKGLESTFKWIYNQLRNGS